MNAQSVKPEPSLHNIEAEQAILGAMLLNNGAYGMVAGILTPEDFAENAHGAIYAECARQISAGKSVSPITLKAAFPDATIGGLPIFQYLVRLSTEATTLINLPDFAQTIRDLAVMREIVHVAHDLRTARDALLAPDAALNEAWDKLDSLRSAPREGGSSSIGALADRLVIDTEEKLSGKIDKVPTTGLTDLDKVLAGGYRPGRLIVVAGRPGMGKTVIAVESARRVARAGYGVAFFSLEIDEAELSARFLASEMAHSHTPLDYRDILAGNLNGLEPDQVRAAAERIRDLPIEIDTTGGLSFPEINARARVMCDRWRKQGITPGAIFIDYLGLIKSSERYRGNKVHELGETALGSKNMAKRLDVATVLLAQLSRQVESREDKRPIISDLRDSGEIEEHADAIGLLYRPHYYDQNSAKVRAGDEQAQQQAHDRRHDLDLLWGKNRLGPTLPVRLWCDVGKSSVDNARHGWR